MDSASANSTLLKNLALVSGYHPGQVSLVLHKRSNTAGEFQDRLEKRARAVEEATAGAISVIDGDGRGLPDLPALTVRVGDRDVAHYLAVPEGPEEAPFLEMLMALEYESDVECSLTALEGISGPVEITVFIAHGCPNCPRGVRAATELAVACKQVTVSVVDAGEFAESASTFSIQSVPTTIVNGGLTLVGVRPPGELESKIVEQQGPGAEEAVFASLVKSGRLNDARSRLLAGKAFAAYGNMWGESTLESRITLSLTAQQALDEDPQGLDDLVPLLLPSLHSDDVALRGDTADLLGAIGNPDAVPELKRLLEDDFPDVAEAAADALECIEERESAT